MDYRSVSQLSEDNEKFDAPAKERAHLRPSDYTARYAPFLWTTEVFSYALAVVALGAVVLTLGVHDQKPLPEWPFAISINSLVAIFTAIFKALLLFPVVEGIGQFKWLWFSTPQRLVDMEHLDMASRGPVGAFRLILNMIIGRRRYYVASFGAVIVVAALVIDPLSQQIIQYSPCMQQIKGLDARIPRAINYSTAGMHIGPGQATLDGPMQVAIYTGVMAPPANSSSSINVDCQTGNCTFPADRGATFSSLAMCYSVDDISDTVSVDYAPSDTDLWIPGNYSLESGAQILDSSGGIPMSNLVSSVEARGIGQFDFETLMLNIGTPCNKERGYCWEPFAVHVALRPCWKTYGANITTGVYRETELSSVPLVLSQDIDNGFALAVNQTLRDGVWYDCTPTPAKTGSNTVAVNSTDSSLPASLFDTTTDQPLPYGPEVLYYPEDCVSVFSFGTLISINGFLNELYGDEHTPVNLTTPGGAFNPSITIGPPGSAIALQNLYRNGTANIDTVRAYMDGLANSMTAQLRRAGDGPDTFKYVLGTPWTAQTCVRVRWVWITFPAALLVLTALFCGAVVLEGWRRRWGGDWKSSALALMFHGVRRKDAVHPGRLPLRGDIYGASSGMRVRLREGDDGWRFFEDM